MPESTDIGQLRLLLIAWMVAGVQTQYEHLRRLLSGRIAEMAGVEVFPHVVGGRIERLPLPSSMRGTLRSTHTVMRALGGRRPDAVWSQVALPMLPYALTRGALQRIPIFYSIDCTPALLWQFGGHYAATDPDSPKGRLAAACMRLFFRRCAGLLPWSTWAATSMVRDYGADPARVHVIHPGVDIQRWSPAGESRPAGRLRLLFVGADFQRKGGKLLLGLYRRHLRDRCDLHLVTRADPAPEPGVFVYRGFKPDDSELLELYRSCDILVLPTLADCFSMAALEAMSCGLPVVISAVGGIPEIVIHGETGALVTPGDAAGVLGAVQALVERPELRLRWGVAGRERVRQHFNAATQADRTLSRLVAAQEALMANPALT